MENEGAHFTLSTFHFQFGMAESPTNNVEVAVGTDTDGNGVLGVDEADWTIGTKLKMENGKLKMEVCKTLSTFHFPFSIRHRRGLGVSAEQVLVKCKQQGTCVFVK